MARRRSLTGQLYSLAVPATTFEQPPAVRAPTPSALVYRKTMGTTGKLLKMFGLK